jgi:hypothetical protein
MKNGFTPKEYAYSIAADALFNAFHNRFGELDGLTPVQAKQASEQIDKLRTKLLDAAKLDSTALHKD